MARGLKFRIFEVDGLYYLCSETKALISFAVTAKLICLFVFRIIKRPVFLRRGSNFNKSHFEKIMYPFFEVSVKAQKPGCSTTENGYRLEFLN